mmetsp:Transcript_32306/g.57149  ORF Transcript_32306/g.57149 Transcript_32306/m.57149 type:complete len:595 (-) Transcript_32306:290-2074(-)
MGMSWRLAICTALILSCFREVFSNRHEVLESSLESFQDETDHNVLLQSSTRPAILVSKLPGAAQSAGMQQAALWTMPNVRSGACLWTYQLLPTGVLLLLMSIALFLLARRVHQVEVDEAARSVGSFQQFVGLANYSALIVDSFQLTMAVGHSAGASGRLIGMYMLGTAIGGVLMWGALKWRLQIWKDWPRQILISVCSSNLISFILSVWITSWVTNHADNGQAYGLLCLCRFISGIGHGVGAQLLQVSFAYLTPVRERPQQMVRFFFVNTLGIGLGPILVGGVWMLDLCPPGTGHFELSGIVQCLLAGASLVGITALYPDLQAFDPEGRTEVSGRSSSKSVSEAARQLGLELPEEWNFHKRRIRVCGCLLMALLRAQVTSGVESATSYLLENKHHWARHEIGISIGLTFLCCIPAKMVLDYHTNLSVLCKIRIMSVISIMGSLLLYHAGPVLLLAADILLFPSLYLSDGLSRGLMQQYALPTGSMLDQNHTTLWAGILSNGVGRYLGPWLSRLIIEKAGQPAYCFMQILLALSFLVIFEALVAECDLLKSILSVEENAIQEPVKDNAPQEPAKVDEKPQQAASEPESEKRCAAS